MDKVHLRIFTYCPSWYKGPANPSDAMGSPGKAISLHLPSPPLLKLHGELPALPSCPCPGSKIGKPLQETEGVSSHHGDTDSSPDLPHDLAEVPLTLPASSSCFFGSLGLGKQQQKLVEIIRQVSIRSSNQTLEPAINYWEQGKVKMCVSMQYKANSNYWE